MIVKSIIKRYLPSKKKYWEQTTSTSQGTFIEGEGLRGSVITVGSSCKITTIGSTLAADTPSEVPSSIGTEGLELHPLRCSAQ